ncbi:MAG: hypothetical protein GPJ54_03230 [Candidatus Heimdallarchaeota archaeon]|nr:hypothetical protein [Candidatus Heimdallarchaeota archaeon]
MQHKKEDFNWDLTIYHSGRKANINRLYKQAITFDNLIQLFHELRENKVRFMTDLGQDKINEMSRGDVLFSPETVGKDQPTFTTKAEYLMALLSAQVDVLCAHMWYLYPFKMYNYFRRNGKRDAITAVIYILFSLDTNIFAEEFVNRESSKKIKRKARLENMPQYAANRKKYNFIMELLGSKYPTYEAIMGKNTDRIQEVKDRITLVTVNSINCNVSEYDMKYKLQEESNFNWYYALVLHADLWQMDGYDMDDPTFFLMFPMISSLNSETLQSKQKHLLSFGAEHNLLKHEFEFLCDNEESDKDNFDLFQENTDLLSSVLKSHIGIEMTSELQIKKATEAAISELDDIDPSLDWKTHPFLQSYVTNRLSKLEAIREIRSNPEDYNVMMMTMLCDNLLILQANCIVVTQSDDPDVFILNDNQIWWNDFSKYIKMDNPARQKDIDEFLSENNWQDLYHNNLLTKEEEEQIIRQIGDVFGDFIHETADLLQLRGESLEVLLPTEMLTDEELGRLARLLNHDEELNMLHTNKSQMDEDWRMAFGNRLVKYLKTSIESTGYSISEMDKEGIFEYLTGTMSSK